MLTDEQIKIFQELYKNRFGEEISREVAYEKAMKLIELITLVYKPTENKEPINP